MMALWFKLFHIVAVIAFIGNISTGLFWHLHAARTRDAKILAHTMDGIIRSDRIFTNPGAILIVLFGFGAAGTGHYPILHTGWVLWTIILFTISGITFGLRLVPLQRRMRDFAAAGVAGGNFDYAAYHAMAKRWELWGAVALGAPLAGLALMVLKPF
jgi:uncharacterized membrane protein